MNRPLVFFRARRRALVHVALLSICWASALGSQVPASDTITLGHAVRALGVAARVGKLPSAFPDDQRVLDSLTVAFESIGAASLPVRSVAEALQPNADGRRLGFRTLDREQMPLRTRAFHDGVLRLLGIGNVQIVTALRSEQVPPDSIKRLLAPFDALVIATRAAARARNMTALTRLERKYGPGSPQLNYVEVGLNYVAQFVPGFRSSESGGPSPLELIASYSSLSLKVSDTSSATASMVSAGRLGLRIYFFGDGWGKDGRFSRYLRPAHGSLGLMSLGPKDDPLQRAWGRGYRAGPFVAWGDLFAGYVGGSNHGVVVGTNKFIIPRVF